MDKQKTIYLLVGLVVTIILLFGSVMFKLIAENGQCVNNPFTYGARTIEEKGMAVMCRCDSLNPEYVGFSYDKEGIYVNEDHDYISFDNVGLSNINGDEGGEGVPQS